MSMKNLWLNAQSPSVKIVFNQLNANYMYPYPRLNAIFRWNTWLAHRISCKAWVHWTNSTKMVIIFRPTQITFGMLCLVFLYFSIFILFWLVATRRFSLQQLFRQSIRSSNNSNIENAKKNRNLCQINTNNKDLEHEFLQWAAKQTSYKTVQM